MSRYWLLARNRHRRKSSNLQQSIWIAGWWPDLVKLGKADRVFRFHGTSGWYSFTGTFLYGAKNGYGHGGMWPCELRHIIHAEVVTTDD